VQVVLNRLRHPDFPKSVCGVVYQGAERDIGCQFTFTCDGAMKRPVDGEAWDEAKKIAQRALGGFVDRAVGTATYYHADYVFPTWAPTLVKMAKVGPHVFYRMAGAEGAAAYLTGRYAGNELKLVRAVLRAGDKHTQKGKPATERESFKQADAYVWHPDGRLAAVPRVSRVELFLLRGVDRMRDILMENTERFANGLPANNALLWGARGMGKSSLVKAAHASINADRKPADQL